MKLGIEGEVAVAPESPETKGPSLGSAGAAAGIVAWPCCSSVSSATRSPDRGSGLQAAHKCHSRKLQGR